MSPNGTEAAAVLAVLHGRPWSGGETRTGAGWGDSAGHRDRDGRWNMPLPGTRSRPITPPAARFHIPSLQSPPSPGMKPGLPKCHPWLCERSPSKGNQPPLRQNNPDKMPKLRSRGLHPGVELCQPLKLTGCPAKGSAPVLWGQERSAPSPLPPCLSFPLVKGTWDQKAKKPPASPSSSLSQGLSCGCAVGLVPAPRVSEQSGETRQLLQCSSMRLCTSVCLSVPGRVLRLGGGCNARGPPMPSAKGF